MEKETYMKVWFPDMYSHLGDDNKTYLIPEEMRFNEGNLVSIVFYSIFMLFSATGNISVLVLLVRRSRAHMSRINNLLIHLAVADLLVTFTLMPLEIFWAATVSWWAGDLACRIASFFRIFGLYQSSFILVSIGIDRYYAVLKPMKISEANKRGKFIIIWAWSMSVICSLPQVFIFHVEKHPNITTYEQCITYNSFPSEAHEFTYSVFGMVTMYVLPLMIIIYCYASILREICKRSKEGFFTDKMRRSNLDFFSKAKIRTLNMTIIIILAFFICWTPYYVMAFWYWVERESAKKVDLRIQKALFLFACTNSSLNPVVYGLFNIRKRPAIPNRTRGSNTVTTEIRMQQIAQSRVSVQIPAV